MSTAVKKSREQARRRLAAFTFLSNISLDGSHKDTNLSIFIRNDNHSASTNLSSYTTTHLPLKTAPIIISSTTSNISSLQKNGENPVEESTSEERRESLCRLTQSEERIPYLNHNDCQSPRFRVYSFMSDTKARISNIAQKRKRFVRQSSVNSSIISSSDNLGKATHQISSSLSDSSDQSCSIENVGFSRCGSPSHRNQLRVNSPFHIPSSKFYFLTARGSPICISSFCSLTKRDILSRPESRQENNRRRHLSGSKYIMTTYGLFGLVNVIDGKEVSYSEFLCPSCPSQSQSLSLHELYILYQSQTELEDNELYHPSLLDNPDLYTGKHCTVLRFPSYKSSILTYVRVDELKRELNEKFRDRFPLIQVTLSKIRSLKKEMFRVGHIECNLDLMTIAQSIVYFEKIILKLLVTKANRKLCAGTCMLLAAKLNDVKGSELTNLIEKTEAVMKLNHKELLMAEMEVLVALKFGLMLQEWEVLPHYHQLLIFQP